MSNNSLGITLLFHKHNSNINSSICFHKNKIQNSAFGNLSHTLWVRRRMGVGEIANRCSTKHCYLSVIVFFPQGIQWFLKGVHVS